MGKARGAGRGGGERGEDRVIALQPDVEVRPSEHGRSVFAARAFAEGEVVEDCPFLVLEEDVAFGGALADYVFEHHEQEGRWLLLLGFGSLYNHSETPNVEHTWWDDEPGIMSMVATRAIEAGEELRTHYSDGWWTDRGETPG